VSAKTSCLTGSVAGVKTGIQELASGAAECGSVAKTTGGTLDSQQQMCDCGTGDKAI
jgi:hypothetical protein